MKEKEYELLYNGMTKAENLINNSRNLLYTVSTAMIAFVFTQGIINPFFFLIPFTIIIPMYYMSIKYVKGMFRIAAYIIIFYERDNDIKWQTRLFNFRPTVKDTFRRRYLNYDSLPYLLISTICLTLYFFNLIALQGVYIFIIEIVVGVLFLAAITFITLKQESSLMMEKRYIDEWNTIKEKELKNKLYNTVYFP